MKIGFWIVRKMGWVFNALGTRCWFLMNNSRFQRLTSRWMFKEVKERKKLSWRLFTVFLLGVLGTLPLTVEFALEHRFNDILRVYEEVFFKDYNKVKGYKLCEVIIRTSSHVWRHDWKFCNQNLKQVVQIIFTRRFT